MFSSQTKFLQGLLLRHDVTKRHRIIEGARFDAKAAFKTGIFLEIESDRIAVIAHRRGLAGHKAISFVESGGRRVENTDIVPQYILPLQD